MTEQDNADMQQIRGRISFGLDVQQFMNGPIGHRLQANANAVILETDVALRSVDAEDPKAIRALQQKSAAASYFLEWMEEFVIEGEQAEAAFRAQDASQE